jgi:hypothetical protein
MKQYRYIAFSPTIEVDMPKKIKNLKRLQREIHKQMGKSISTKS